MCHKPIDLYEDYRDLINDQILTHEQYFEHQLNMSDDEKEQRQVFFERFFAEYGRN